MQGVCCSKTKPHRLRARSHSPRAVTEKSAASASFVGDGVGRVRCVRAGSSGMSEDMFAILNPCCRDSTRSTYPENAHNHDNVMICSLPSPSHTEGRNRYGTSRVESLSCGVRWSDVRGRSERVNSTSFLIAPIPASSNLPLLFCARTL